MVPRVRAALVGLALTLVVAIPTMAVEEDWHGRPMIDQPNAGWAVPMVIVALAFAAGGALAARLERRVTGAVAQGAVVGLAAVAVLLAADAVRRAAGHETLPAGVVHLWIAAAAGSAFLAVAGAVIGHLGWCRRPVSP